MGTRVLSLSAALAFEWVYGATLKDLFPEEWRQIMEEIRHQAATLIDGLREEPTAEFALKLETLQRLVNTDDQIILPLWDGDA